MEKSTNLFLKYQSKSEKAYYQFTNLFNLNPLDTLVMWYLMHMYQKSTYHGKDGKGGKCFYRNDRKFTGYYVGSHYKDIAKQVPAKTSVKSVKRSIERLQDKGLLYHHRSINNVQIFLPIFDEDVRKSFNDPNYKTVINFDEIYKGQNDLSARVKMTFAQRSKWTLRKCQNDLCNNVPLTNEPKTNEPLNNVVVSPLKRVDSNNDNKQQQRKLPKWIINNLNKSVANLLVNNVKDVKTVATKIIDVIFSNNRNYYNIMGSSYYKTKTNPYLQDGGLIKSLKVVFNDKKDLKDTISNDYKDYINANSSLKLKNSKKPKDNGLDYKGNDKTTTDKVRESRNEIDLLNKGKEHAKSTKEKQKIQSKIEKEAHFICNNSDDELWAIDGTTESHTHLHPTSKAMQRKIKKQLHDLDRRDNDPYIDGNGEEHVTVKHDIFKPKQKSNTIDMDEIENNFEKEDED